MVSNAKGPGPLADVLQAWRARVSPDSVDLPTYGEHRRVSGLRREELAMLAGVSPSYYARLEQGQSRNASPEVLDAIATALRLDDAERRHLHVLARVDRRRVAVERPPSQRVDPGLAQLLHTLGDIPAVVLDRRKDVLAWNATGHALLAGGVDRSAVDRPAQRPNLAELVFRDPHSRDLYVDWPAKAREVVGNLRLMAGQHPDDPHLASLVGSLSMASPEFAGWWADHRVRACSGAAYDLHHPLVGRLTVTQQALLAQGGSEQYLVTCTAAPGSTSAAALTLLAQLVADRPQRGAELSSRR